MNNIMDNFVQIKNGKKYFQTRTHTKLIKNTSQLSSQIAQSKKTKIRYCRPQVKVCANADQPTHLLNLYMRESFNPKYIPTLISDFMHYYGTIQVNKGQLKSNKPDKSKQYQKLQIFIKSICNSCSMSILITNMKLYDTRQITRENQLIQQCFQYQKVIFEGIDNKEDLYLNKQRRVSKNTIDVKKNNQQQDIKQINSPFLNKNLVTQLDRQKINSEIKTSTQNKNLFLNKLCQKIVSQNTKIDKVVQYLNLSDKIFHILQYRLKDLSSFIAGINDFIEKSKTIDFLTKQVQGVYNHYFKFVRNVIFTLEQLCNYIVKQMGKIKGKFQFFINTCFKRIEQYAVQGGRKNHAQLSANFQSNIRDKEVIQKGYFNIKKYAKQLMQKLRQIQTKYTKFSRQLNTRQQKYKQYRTYIDESNVFKIKINYSNSPFSKNTNKFDIINQGQNQQDPNLLNVPQLIKTYSSVTNKLSSNQIGTNGSIIRKCNFTSRSKYKRISLEVITNLIQSEKARKIKQLLGDKNSTNKQSRFAHRAGFNIGTGHNICQLLNISNQKIKKKQVKIKNIDTSESVIKKQTDRSSVKSRFSRSLKNVSCRSKDSKLSNFLQGKQIDGQQFQRQRKQSKFKFELKQKSLKQLKRKKAYSFQEINDSVTSRSLNKSNKQRSKNRSKRQLSRRQTSRRLIRRSYVKKMTQIYHKQNSSSSSDEDSMFKNLYSMKIINDHKLNQSLKILIDFAKQRKRQNRYGFRSGHILPNDLSQRLLQEKIIKNQRLDLVYKKVENRRKSKLMRKHKQKQNKYAQLMNISKESKQKQTSRLNKKGNKQQGILQEPKSFRRIGKNNLVIFDRVKTSQSQEQKRDNLKSQLTSNFGSRKYNISNNRINFNSDEDKQFNSSKYKHKLKTQQSQRYNIPEQYKVSFEDRLTFVNDFVQFYPNIECSLYKISKQNMKYQQMVNFQTKAQTKLLQQFGQMPNLYVKKYVHQERSEVEQEELQAKRKLFKLQGQRLEFSKKFTISSNELQQKEMHQFKEQIKTKRQEENKNLQKSRRNLFRQNDNNYYQ